jgi:hypothetical protein
MEKEETQKQCFNCAYKMKIPRDAHISCLFAWGKAGLNMPRGNPHGVMQGWYQFPFSFDPIWMVGECPAFSTVADPETKSPMDSFSRLIAILGKRL